MKIETKVALAFRALLLAVALLVLYTGQVTASLGLVIITSLFGLVVSFLEAPPRDRKRTIGRTPGPSGLPAPAGREVPTRAVAEVAEPHAALLEELLRLKRSQPTTGLVFGVKAVGDLFSGLKYGRVPFPDEYVADGTVGMLADVARLAGSTPSHVLASWSSLDRDNPECQKVLAAALSSEELTPASMGTDALLSVSTHFASTFRSWIRTAMLTSSSDSIREFAEMLEMLPAKEWTFSSSLLNEAVMLTSDEMDAFKVYLFGGVSGGEHMGEDLVRRYLALARDL